MSDKFFKLARQEIELEINSLQEIFHTCLTDQQFYERTRDIEKHLHKIKGLAPMMGEEKIGKLAKISDLITRQVMKQGITNGSHDIILNSIHMMQEFFNGKINEINKDFEKNVRKAFPKIFDNE